MKTIELKNQEKWFIFQDDEGEETKYFFTDEVFSKLESIIVIAIYPLGYHILKGPLLSAPNLKDLGFFGDGCSKCFQSLNENGIYAPNIESIYFDNIGITIIPDFVLKLLSLKRLSIQNKSGISSRQKGVSSWLLRKRGNVDISLL